MPPPESKICLELSIASATAGSELKAAVNDPIGPKPGLTAQTIAQGSAPRSKNTAIKSPHKRNHFLALLLMVERTSALITALSIEETVSKSTRPRTTKMIDKISIFNYNTLVQI